MHKQDTAIIKAILAGDQDQFAILIERYENMVFSLSLKLLKDRSEAEEVAQLSFIKAYESLKKYDGNAKFNTWLYRITYNTCLDRIRVLQRQQGNSIADTQPEQEQPIRLEQLEKKNAISAAIAELSELDQWIVILYYYEEKNMKEISHILDQSVANVKVRLHRSRKQLKNLLHNNAAI
ncbi:MAG: sigma-70 family RNA polymerase sigma factor [Bacteroidia bacterium]